ncbi:acetyl-CoA C-acyltransferase [Aliiglaciecola sp. 2_MG-2023]|uniref:acetyl-CoA C-acyltransferase n=1 Tax=unclassified Aliiglaciecola TaxID=2593648 RepID=UPI0026E14260|nr:MULTISPECIES: acetyl-CoA C-acyltransferase [unclassified Aliiglaciecola]MDO6711584.1 acetyl-CoA C-acyltransferase [Aliiglaciecola sp. 2_MG-2023]MDO6752655.1 acetyl-CoA C-acyltransferase [Aliiglaciecola sp. 1_MG-2023]
MAYIFDAVRTPRGKGKEGGALAAMKPDELVSKLIGALQQRSNYEMKPDALILGAVGQVGSQGGNIALVSKFRAKLPDSTTAFSLNNFCVSGLTAISQAAAMIEAGQGEIALAGGVEMMSSVPFMADNADFYTDRTLPVRSRYLLVALAADRLAEDQGISRQELDQAALSSQQLTQAGEGTGLVASRIAVNGLDREECLHVGSIESLASLKPAFGGAAKYYKDILGREIDHRHTIAHAPPISDGAGLALIGAKDAIDAKPRARIVACAEVGGDPAESLTAGIAAMEKVFERSGLSLADMDRIEYMEAFAVSIVKFIRDFDVSPEKVNVAGGHLAKGHPLGASGAILLSTLLDTLDVANGRYGLVVAAGASGIGSAMIVERLGE